MAKRGRSSSTDQIGRDPADESADQPVGKRDRRAIKITISNVTKATRANRARARDLFEAEVDDGILSEDQAKLLRLYVWKSLDNLLPDGLFPRRSEDLNARWWSKGSDYKTLRVALYAPVDDQAQDNVVRCNMFRKSANGGSGNSLDPRILKRIGWVPNLDTLGHIDPKYIYSPDRNVAGRTFFPWVPIEDLGAYLGDRFDVGSIVDGRLVFMDAMTDLQIIDEASQQHINVACTQFYQDFRRALIQHPPRITRVNDTSVIFEFDEEPVGMAALEKRASHILDPLVQAGHLSEAAAVSLRQPIAVILERSCLYYLDLRVLSLEQYQDPGIALS